MSNPGHYGRILVIDDEDSVLDTYLQFLAGNDDAELDELGDLMGMERSGEKKTEGFDVETASQGREGLEKVRSALDSGEPFAVAFIDVRMPPGWDGVDTARRIRQIDPDIHIVFVTAYSDYDVNEIYDSIGDNMIYLKKPFQLDVIAQMARNLCGVWNRERSTKQSQEWDGLMP